MDKKSNGIAVIVIIVVIFIFVAICSSGSGSSKSEWSKLSKEEKAWYKRNYGNGKSESINNAINNYKNK